MDDKKVFDRKKGGRPDIRDESSAGFQYEQPRSPAITVRERADKTRDPIEYDEPKKPELNYLKHRKQATEAVEPRKPAEIESNAWRPFSTGKGGTSDIKDDDAGKAGVHHYEAPEIPNLDFTKSWRKK